MPILKDFTVDNRWWWGWAGGGHTVETDPTNRGWRCARVKKGEDLVLLGRRGVKGCMTIRPLSNGLDVAFYDELAPEDLIRDGIPPADDYKSVDLIPGWALPLIQEVESSQGVQELADSYGEE